MIKREKEEKERERMLIPSNKKTFESTYDRKPSYTDFTDIYNKFRDLINSKIRIKTHFIVIKIIDYKKKKRKEKNLFPFCPRCRRADKDEGRRRRNSSVRVNRTILRHRQKRDRIVMETLLSFFTGRKAGAWKDRHLETHPTWSTSHEADGILGVPGVR